MGSLSQEILEALSTLVKVNEPQQQDCKHGRSQAGVNIFRRGRNYAVKVAWSNFRVETSAVSTLEDAAEMCAAIMQVSARASQRRV